MSELKRIEFDRFKDCFTGFYDCDGQPIYNGMTILIIDKNITGDVRYSIRRGGFRIFTKGKAQEAKTYSIAYCGKDLNPNLRISEYDHY